jgi:hypothetical protein
VDRDARDHRRKTTRERLSPHGNKHLTAAVGVRLLVPIVVELVSIVLGVHSFMSLHVFVGFLLIPPVLLKLGSTGWRFFRYYTRSDLYLAEGPPQLAMRLLAPLLVAATVVLFGSGVAMGLLQGHALTLARRLHGPSSVVWIVLVGVHVLVYLKRSLVDTTADVASAVRSNARGSRRRLSVLGVVAASGLVIGAATVPAQHRWVDLPRDHHRHGERRLSELLPARRRSRKGGTERLRARREGHTTAVNPPST